MPECVLKTLACWGCVSAPIYSPRVANPPTSYRSLSGPPGLKSQKGLKKSPGAGSQKVWKKSRKSPDQTFSRLFPDFGLFRDFFQTFFRLFGISGPEGLGDSCSSREGSQPKSFWKRSKSTSPHLQHPKAHPCSTAPCSYGLLCSSADCMTQRGADLTVLGAPPLQAR